MKVTNEAEKSEFLSALADPRSVIMLLYGDPNPKAQAVDDKAAQLLADSNWKVCWLTDLSVLVGTEIKDLSVTPEEYVTLSTVRESGPRIQKRGKIGKLFQGNGQVSAMFLRKAFTDSSL